MFSCFNQFWRSEYEDDDEEYFEMGCTSYDDYDKNVIINTENKGTSRNLNLVKIYGSSRVTSEAKFKRARTEQDIQKITEKFEAIRLIHCKKMNVDPSTETPFTEWKPSLKEMDQIRRGDKSIKVHEADGFFGALWNILNPWTPASEIGSVTIGNSIHLPSKSKDKRL